MANVWANAVITSKGLALQSKLTQGHSLNITKAEVGAGYVTPGLLVNQTEVKEVKQTLAFNPVSYPEEGQCAMPLILYNEGVKTGYLARQIGIFATDPEEGEILYFIAQSADEERGTEVPAESEMAGYSAEWTFYFQYGQADDVTVLVDKSNTVTWGGLDQFVAENFIAITDLEIDNTFDSE